ncbi:KAP-like P-loop domain-containing protein [Kordia periserrulae]|uniref:KAP-like P-loop domain-containing protein n=1 Tax=Kordia periserrulae TaxID=701523 RepID=A0A2T6C6C5_9FLAO|nr:P-loop NTPase fold protein [Kordia periserrulae]PTX63881.1 KAP-like P-loop domain-containing protein [Kordia periserrulae]
MAKLLNNLPIEDLKKENDYLGVIDKAELIKTILESNTDQFHEIKMFVLYGDWGSGKSTLMKYLERELKEDFNTFFFDTWQFEKDDNLPQTLLDFLLKESEADTISKDFVKYAVKLFRGFGKSIKVKYQLYENGPSVDFNPSELVKEFEKGELSFYEALEKFKTEFVRWECHTTKKKKKKYNIIFIDDLDRCEPENVLNLLSAIKLFFTYGKKTIFFFGIDKKAVQQAIQTKYKDAVKSEEYLEKIFDISFSMPKHESVLKLVSHYFDERDVAGEKLNERIANFFRALHFTNPRKLKKVLNKYLLLANAKESLPEAHPFLEYTGNIYTEKSSNENYFETILTLYLITVKEFNPELFKILFDFKLKTKTFREAVFKMNPDSINNKWGRVNNSLEDNLYKTEFEKIFLTNILPERSVGFARLMLIFCPANLTDVAEGFYAHDKIFKSIYLEEKRIDYYFLKYVGENLDFFKTLKSYSNKSISDIYQGVKQIL